MKIIAMYLPQYHRIKENDEWWGSGYTEWTAVKGAQPLYQNHIQPKIPLNDNYYDLSDLEAFTWKWQAYLANEYGVYGFCIYHYWFETGSQLLEKPMEILLEHPEIDIRYCICWANESWTRTWYDLNKQILKKQKYGNANDWEDHFNYLLKFFRDKRYIKIDNKPVVHIYHTFEIKKMAEMRKVWETLSKINGFSGIYIVSGNTIGKIDKRVELFDAYYNFEPGFTFMHVMDIKYKIFYFIRKKFIQCINFLRGRKKLEGLVNAKWIYKNNRKKSEFFSKKCFLGTFPAWDNTPRRRYKGRVYESTPELFYENLRQIQNKLDEIGRSDDFVYINAWNEWGEGAYLEPDTVNLFSYLEKIKLVLKGTEK